MRRVQVSQAEMRGGMRVRALLPDGGGAGEVCCRTQGVWGKQRLKTVAAAALHPSVRRCFNHRLRSSGPTPRSRPRLRRSHSLLATTGNIFIYLLTIKNRALHGLMV